MTDRERAFELLRKGHELDNENKAIIIDALGGMPKRTGHWIKSNPFMLSECSECGNKAFGYHSFDEVLTDFCPNCGADMRGGERRCKR